MRDLETLSKATPFELIEKLLDKKSSPRWSNNFYVGLCTIKYSFRIKSLKEGLVNTLFKTAVPNTLVSVSLDCKIIQISCLVFIYVSLSKL